MYWLLTNEPIVNFYTNMRVKDFSKTLSRLSGPESVTAAPIQENETKMFYPYTHTLKTPMHPHLEQHSAAVGVRFERPDAWWNINKKDFQ